MALLEGSPIALFVYRRPAHTSRAIKSLLTCDEFANSPLFVFSDGPKSLEDVQPVNETRSTVQSLLGNRAQLTAHDNNQGCANSIIAGVTDLCERYGSVIVVEDDLVVSPHFLRFLNEGLSRYADESRVMQISGHMFDTPSLRARSEALFLPMTTSWGWATWQRAWQRFDPDVLGWKEFLDNTQQKRAFNLNGKYPYSNMLHNQMNHNKAIDAWDIRWYYSVYRQHGLTLFPSQSLVANMGLDGSGTHERLAAPSPVARFATEPITKFPDEIEESEFTKDVFNAVRAFRRSTRIRKALALPGKWIGGS